MFIHKLSAEAELRMLEPHHADELFSLIDANREHLRRWLGWVDNTQGPDDCRTFIRESLSGFAKRGDFVAGIWFDGRLAGTIGLADVNTHCGRADLGYWLGRDFEGKGLVTMACRAIIDHAFGALGLNRIQIRVEPDNERSKAVPERLGFKLEGTLRQVGRVYDRLVNLEVYSVLREEWHSGGASCQST